MNTSIPSSAPVNETSNETPSDETSLPLFAIIPIVVLLGILFLTAVAVSLWNRRKHLKQAAALRDGVVRVEFAEEVTPEIVREMEALENNDTLPTGIVLRDVEDESVISAGSQNDEEWARGLSS